MCERAHGWSPLKPASKGTKQVEKSWGVDLREAIRENQPRHRSVGSEGEVWRRMFQSRGISKGRGHEVGQVQLKQMKKLMVAGGEIRTGSGGRSCVALKARERTFTQHNESSEGFLLCSDVHCTSVPPDVVWRIRL